MRTLIHSAYRLTVFAATGALLLALLPATAHSQRTISGTDADGRGARARFEINGSNLLITLTNTGAYDASVPTDVLTGLFFEYDQAGVSFVNNATSSVSLAPGATVINNGGVSPSDVGGEYAFRAGTDFFKTFDYGVSSAGLGLFGPGDRFPGANLSGPENVGGLQYGITTASDTGNNNGGASVPLIKNAVVIKLSALTPGGSSVNLDAIGKVRFQYGTSAGVGTDPEEPSITVDQVTPSRVPEPGSLSLLAGVGLMAAGFAARRRA